MEEGHSREIIAQQILQVVNDYGVTGRVISITMDNASANDRAINILRGALNPISYPYFFHSRCVAHILNLVVQDGMKEMDSTLKDIRDAVTYLNGSHQREAPWRRACELNQLRPKMIANDMPVRWNSTYLMLQSIIPYAESFTVWYNNEQRGSCSTNGIGKTLRCSAGSFRCSTKRPLCSRPLCELLLLLSCTN